MKSYIFVGGFTNFLAGCALGILVAASTSAESMPLLIGFAGLTVLSVMLYVMYVSWKSLKILLEEEQ